MLFQKGSQGFEVTRIQTLLKKLGFLKDKVDGDFGNNTKSAVMAYQKSRKLDIDGVAGPNTIKAMQKDGLSFEVAGGATVSQEFVDKFTKLVIDYADDFVGMVETKSNAQWDDPKIAGWQKEKNDLLVKYLKQTKWWDLGAAYCASQAAVCVLMALEKMGLFTNKWKSFWTAHVMTNVRALKEKGILSSYPVPGAIWLARHGSTDSGHAGVVITCNNSTMTTVEGNTSASNTADPELQRQGDGIYKRNGVPISGRGTLKTQGFLHPINILKFLV